MTYHLYEELSPESRIAVLEEHARQEMHWRSNMIEWRERIVREVTAIHVKVAFFSAIGAAIGSTIVGLVIYYALHGNAPAPTSHH